MKKTKIISIFITIIACLLGVSYYSPVYAACAVSCNMTCGGVEAQWCCSTGESCKPPSATCAMGGCIAPGGGGGTPPPSCSVTIHSATLGYYDYNDVYTPVSAIDSNPADLVSNNSSRRGTIIANIAAGQNHCSNVEYKFKVQYWDGSSSWVEDSDLSRGYSSSNNYDMNFPSRPREYKVTMYAKGDNMADPPWHSRIFWTMNVSPTDPLRLTTQPSGVTYFSGTVTIPDYTPLLSTDGNPPSYHLLIGTNPSIITDKTMNAPGEIVLPAASFMNDTGAPLWTIDAKINNFTVPNLVPGETYYWRLRQTGSSVTTFIPGRPYTVPTPPFTFSLENDGDKNGMGVGSVSNTITATNTAIGSTPQPVSFKVVGGSVPATENAGWSGRIGHGALVFNNKMWIIGGNDTGTTSGYKNDVWSSPDGVNWTQVTGNAAWSARGLHSVLVFDNKMWIIGGTTATGSKNDVWSSSDGMTWIQVTGSAAWSARYSPASLVFNNKMWVFGGYSTTGYKNDVWSSTDGITWTQVTGSAAWSARSEHTSLVYDNKIWILGGYDGGYKNDVWSSTDGVNWTQVTGNAAWSARYSLTSLFFGNKMWVLGGTTTTGYKNDVWSSTDGITWTQVTGSAAWSARRGHASLVFDTNMWVLGGNYKNDIWINPSQSVLPTFTFSSNSCTPNIDNACQVTLSATLPPDLNTTSVVVYGTNGTNIQSTTFKIVRPAFNFSLTNGGDKNGMGVESVSNTITATNTAIGSTPQSISFSVDNPGSDLWALSTGNAAWQKRSGHTSLVFNNKMWVLGGSNKNDVWSSTDGITWTQVTGSAAWSARRMHTSLVFDNKMWVLGGYDINSNAKNDVWSSTDGITWTQVTGSAAWSARFSHTSLVFNNRMWVLGGYSAGYKNDVWSSTDGITWTQVTGSAAWSARASYASLVSGTNMWVLGGENAGDKNDVWSSTDGITWTQVTGSAAWSARRMHAVLAFDNKMWVLGGYSNSSGDTNDVWFNSGQIIPTTFTFSSNSCTPNIDNACQVTLTTIIPPGMNTASITVKGSDGTYNRFTTFKIVIPATGSTTTSLSVNNQTPSVGDTINFSGLLKDSANSPIPGSTISLINVANGAVIQTGTTNNVGNFTINLPISTSNQFSVYAKFNGVGGVNSSQSNNITITPLSCSGNILLTLSNTGGNLTPVASELSSCDGKTVTFKIGDSCDTGTAFVPAKTCSVSGSGCSGSIFTAPVSTTTYSVCIDKNNVNGFSDPGETAQATFTVGAGLTTSCQTGDRASGLISVGSSSITGNFGNSIPGYGPGGSAGPVCILDPKAAFSPYKLPTYEDLRSIYYTQARSSVTEKKALAGDVSVKDGESDKLVLTGSSDYLYHITGNLTINKSIPGVPGPRIGIIFVDGNLEINPTSGKINQNNPAGGLVFVVKGNVYIDQSVEEIDAVIISSGTICTAAEITGGLYSCPAGYLQTAKPLTVNGSLVSLNKDYPIRFRRTLSNNDQPAEVINTDPKFLVILRNLFSSPFQKWTELP